jgi:hypothetical protein
MRCPRLCAPTQNSEEVEVVEIQLLMTNLIRNGVEESAMHAAIVIPSFVKDGALMPFGRTDFRLLDILRQS